VNSCTPDEIRNDPKLYPFFKDVIGAMDGTHIPCNPSAADHSTSHKTAKVVSLKIASHAALLTSISNMVSVGGRGWHVMQQCIRMPILQTCLFLGANSILLMQALALVMLFLFHIGVSVTIFKSGDVPHFGMDPNSLV
jgi:hypothetical protein